MARGNPNYFITYGNGKSGKLGWLVCIVNLGQYLHAVVLLRQGTALLYHASTGLALLSPPSMRAAARVQQGMRPNGAHRWHSYVKTPK